MWLFLPRDSRWVRDFLFSLYGMALVLFPGLGLSGEKAAVSGDGGAAGAAVVQLESDKFIALRQFRQTARINCNRTYAFHDVPPQLVGLTYASHQHKTTATLSCTVLQGGIAFLCLGEGALPETGDGCPSWQVAAEMKGDDSGAVRPWQVFSAMLKPGETFTLHSPNKWGAVLAAGKLVLPRPVPPEMVWEREYRFLRQQLAKRPDAARQTLLAAQTLHPAALLQESDRDPLDVVLRRTQVLLADLVELRGDDSLDAFGTELAGLAESATDLPVKDEKGRKELFRKAVDLRRRIAFRNPLLDFDRIAFLTHHKSRTDSGSNHMCDQYFGFNAIVGGGVYVLENAFGPEPRAMELTRNVRAGDGTPFSSGSFISLELSFDAREMLFAWTAGSPDFREWKPETCYHIFRMGVDGQGLTQLTDGAWNDFDPCFLPDGNLVFISERRGGYGRCHGRPVPTYTLHKMAPDGSGIIPISLHETNEWHPSISNDGMIVYTRWDYVDRDSDVAHHLWLCFPDGRDPRSYHGNYPVDRHSRPWMEMSIRAIPGSHRYMAVAAPHHGQAYGSLILIDLQPEDDNSMSQIRRFSPECSFPEAERGNLMFGTPWPLSETYSLAVFDWDARHYGIYLVDAFGNRVLIFEDPEVPCLDPIPVRPRWVPPTIPVAVREASKETAECPTGSGRVAVMNVYEADQQWPGGTRLSALRIVQVFPKATPMADRPKVGLGAQSLARGVLGTVPIEDDGSVYFEMPANVPVYFQVLDEQGRAVQSMRSDTFVHEGELLSCLGCHEHKRMATPCSRKVLPLALQRDPSRIQAEVADTFPLSFSRLVQPVLDAHCVECHAKNHKAPALAGTPPGSNGWSPAFCALSKFSWAKHGGNGSIKRNGGSRSVPGIVGAGAARLCVMLNKGHHGVTLSPDDMRRITLWLDTNSNFYGAYLDTERQARGEIILPDIQ